jgi:hypothetical protein
MTISVPCPTADNGINRHIYLMITSINVINRFTYLLSLADNVIDRFKYLVTIIGNVINRFTCILTIADNVIDRFIYLMTITGNVINRYTYLMNLSLWLLYYVNLRRYTFFLTMGTAWLYVSLGIFVCSVFLQSPYFLCAELLDGSDSDTVDVVTEQRHLEEELRRILRVHGYELHHQACGSGHRYRPLYRIQQWQGSRHFCSPG